MNIYITEKKREKFFKESFNGTTILSRSGLHTTEKNLFKTAYNEKDLSNCLFVNNRTGALPIYLKNKFPLDNVITVLNVDFHHHNTINKNIRRNKTIINNKCNLTNVPEDKLSLFVMQIDNKTYSKEFYEFLFSKFYNQTKKKGKIIVSCDKRSKWFEDILRINEIPYSLEEPVKGQFLILLRKSVLIDLPLDFKDNFWLCLPDKPELEFTSLPGVFAHHRVDEGALALIENAQVTEKDIVLDMGAGIGSVGIALAKYYNPAKTIFVDSNSIAFNCCKENCTLNNITNTEFHLTDEGVKNIKANVFVGNPPYFSNFRIADLFIDKAYESLAKGGRAYIVAKNITHIYNAMNKVFGNCEVKQRRGFNVAISKK